MNTKPVETLREKEEEMLSSGSCQESLEISRLHPSPSSTCQKFPKSPLPNHSSSGPRTPSRNASNTPALVENPLSSPTPGRGTTPVPSHSPPNLLELSPWGANSSAFLPSSAPAPTNSALSPTSANATSSLLSPTFPNSGLLSPNTDFTAVLPAPTNTPTCRETASRLRDGGAEQGVLMEAATRLQYRMRGEEAEQSWSKLRQHMVEESRAVVYEQQVNQLRSAFPGMDDELSTSEVLATTVDFLHFARTRSGGDLITEFLNARPCK